MADAAAWCLALALVACGGDPPPPLVTGDPAPTREPRLEHAPEGAEGAPVELGAWFERGPGAEVRRARARGDRAVALAALDALLADASVVGEERAACLVLRALEHRDAGRHGAAAEDLEAARALGALGPLDPWMALQLARARLATGDPEGAMPLLAEVAVAESEQPTLAPDRLLAEASARSRTGDRPGAEGSYRRFLAEHAEHPRRFEARVHLADLIETSAPEEAASLYAGVLVAVPLSDYGATARTALDRLRKAGKVPPEQAKPPATLAVEVSELEARLGRGQYRQVVDDAGRLLRRKGLDAGQRCRLAYARASAVFKQRQRAQARAHYERAARDCARTGDDDRVVKSRYQAARGAYAAGAYEDAAKAFEALAADFSEHSYADDALVLAGESWASAGKADRARAAWMRGIEAHPGGDMREELLRRLVVQAFAEDRPTDVLTLADRSLARAGASLSEQARLHYFRGRALAQLGRQDEAETAWVAAVRALPLSYPSCLALSRLRESGEGALARGLAALEGEAKGSAAASKLPRLELPETPAASRARLFAELGLGDEARAELDAAGIGGWPAASVLAAAGMHEAAQRVVASLGTQWRGTPPVGPARASYQVAHPLPFAEIIEPGERRHGVQPRLTFAIMQTESRFDPGATSWAGARGLVQLMPATAKGLARSAGVEIDEQTIYDPALNLDLGMRYLARLEQRWGGAEGAVALAISSYNGGAGNVDKWLAERGSWDLDLFIEAIPFDETRRYTQHVLGRWMAYRWLYEAGQPSERVPYLPLEIPARG